MSTSLQKDPGEVGPPAPREAWPFPWLRSTLESAVIAIYVVLIAVTFLQVIFRYGLQSSLSWSEEMARYLFVWLTFLGAALAVDRGLHITVDVLLHAFPLRFRRAVVLTGHALVAVFLVVFIQKSANVIPIAMTERAPGTGVRMGLVQLAMPIGGLLMLVYTLKKMAQIVWAIRRGEP